MTKLMSFAQNKNTKRVLAIALVCVVMMALACPVMLAATGFDTSSADAIVGNILEFVFQIFRYIGVILLAWSVGQLVLAFKNEDADSKSRAVMLLIVSIVLIGIGPAIKAILGNTITF